MKLLVGLGNPGKRYAATRHNVGFLVVEELAGRWGAGRPRKRFDAEVAEATCGGESALLLRPQTFMNCSGTSVLAVRDFYKIDNRDLLIICDDFNLPVAKLRMRARGSAGGQKGLQDIIRCLGTESVPRLRIGIGLPPENWDAADYVLSKFNEDEQPEMRAAIQRAADAATVWATGGIEPGMNQFNAE
jgi:PTH1 family peptidyl-tRNA hydrolase